MIFWIKIGQIAVAVLLMLSILMQNRGSGLGGVFGGSGGVYLTKRGLEKKLFVATIVLAVIFILLSLFVFLI
ncbi:TPA: preprotein translocase subunit SecG [Candidatus Falkowbacteria bacterium]|nr:preprotein translocase subunit SecG [Candidatus Falkowbacteria bacterium]